MTFQPIASYGFIGNLGSCALVGKNGSIDWCCLPQLDSPSIFGAILDPDVGGKFLIAPAESEGVTEGTQKYHDDTNVLRTMFTCPGGTLEVTDWMHMSSFSFREEEEHRLPALYRVVRCNTGTVRVRIVFDPKLDYARGGTKLSETEGGLLAEGHDDTVRLYASCPFTIGWDGAVAEIVLSEGNELTFLCTYGKTEMEELPHPHRSLERTIAFWRRWATECESGDCPNLGPWRDAVTRSALTLKILAGGSGIAAAATTSLPEIPGGSDNWDYRFNWIRDASFTIQALCAIGHLNDAREFLEWIEEILASSGRRPADLQVLYPLHGKASRKEQELSHLRGYLDSKPVRIGNGAAHQRQHDIYGEILEAVYRSEHLHPNGESALSGILRDIVDYVCEIWREPDSGIWELRAEPEHYVYSKVMCWVAIDRGIKLAREHSWIVDVERWEKERDAIHESVFAHGYDKKRGSFVQSYGSQVLDATALLIPLLEFLPPEHPYAISTLKTIERELATGPLVYRSSAHHSREGAFGFCSFWLVDALALAGKSDRAKENFEQLLSMANHIGLYSEEIDPKTGAFLGNFPQAFTHVGLINSALYLTRFLGNGEEKPPLMGEG